MTDETEHQGPNAASIAAGLAAGQAIDVAVLRAGEAIDRIEHILLLSYIRALLTPRALSWEGWSSEVNRRLRQLRVQIRRDLVPVVDQTIVGAGRDIAEAVATLSTRTDAVKPAEQTLAHLANSWRLGIRGLDASVQHHLSLVQHEFINGKTDLRKAIAKSAHSIVERDIAFFRDRRGRRWFPGTYSEMTLRTAAQSAHTTSTLNAALDTGTNFVVVSDHHRECERCRPFESRILVVEPPVAAPAVATYDDARARGLHHPNCRHQVYAWWPEYDDVPPPGQPDAELYAASQHQRRLEREIRRAKVSAAIGNYGSDPDAVARARNKAAQARKELSELLLEHPDLKRTHWRETPRLGDPPLAAA